MKCLLVEPDYRASYPNVALMKLSTKLKNEGKTAEYFKGIKQRTLDSPYDEIYITSLFTYEAQITLETIKHYQQAFSEARIIVGGIFPGLVQRF